MYTDPVSSLVRKQLYLTKEQSTRLRRVASRQHRTEAEILREALDRHLGAATRTRPEPARDALWKIVGIGRSKNGLLSERVDQILYGRRNR